MFYDCDYSRFCPCVRFFPWRRVPVALHPKFRLPAATSRNPHLPNARITTCGEGNNFDWRAVHADVGTRLADGETSAGWGLSFGPVITTDHLSVAGARVHSNNTAEELSIVEAISFLERHGPFARDVLAFFYHSKHAPGVWWARFMLARTYSLDCCQQLLKSSTQATIYHAARLRSRGELLKRMRRSCRSIGCIWLGVAP